MNTPKRIIALVLCLALCSCNTAPAQQEAQTSAETTAVSTTEAASTTKAVVEASTTAAAVQTTAEASTASEASAEAEESIDITHLSENERTNGYMAALLECEMFNETLSCTDYVQITDLNADGVPEILLCCAPPTVTAVFSFDENGKCVFIEPSEDSYALDDKPFYSYDGFTLEAYSKDGKDIFITEGFLGGSNTGHRCYMIVSYENGKIVSKPLCGYSYHRVLVEGVNGTEYWFGSTDNTMSEEEYNKKLEEYLAECEPSSILLYQIPSEKFNYLNYNEQLKNLSEALDGYFEEAEAF